MVAGKPWAVDVYDYYHKAIVQWELDGLISFQRSSPSDVEFTLFGYVFYVSDQSPMLICRLNKLSCAWTHSIEIEYTKQHPKLAYYFATKVIKGRWPKAEPYILLDAGWAYKYARDVIKGRWPEAEEIIATDVYTHQAYLDWISTLRD